MHKFFLFFAGLMWLAAVGVAILTAYAWNFSPYAQLHGPQDAVLVPGGGGVIFLVILGTLEFWIATRYKPGKTPPESPNGLLTPPGLDYEMPKLSDTKQRDIIDGDEYPR